MPHPLNNVPKGGGGMVSAKSESEKRMGTAFGDGGGGGELV